MKRMLLLCVIPALLLSMLCSCSKSQEEQWQEQYDLGVRYLSEGNYEEAIIAFAAAIEIDPNRAEAYVGRGDAYVASGENAENLNAALSDYEAALELDNTILSAWLSTGEIHVSLGNYEDAIEAYNRALELDPTQAGIYLNIAECYIALDNAYAAMDILEAGFSETNDSALQERLIQLLSSTGDYSIFWTDDMITQEDLTLGGRPFYELSIEEAVALLPEPEPYSIIHQSGRRRYLVTLDDSYWGLDNSIAYGIILVQQLDTRSTLSFLEYHDYYNDMILGIETDIRGISTGDSIETALEKIGIQAGDAQIMSNSGSSFRIIVVSGSNGVYGGIEAYDSQSTYGDILTRAIEVNMDEYTLRMDFIEDRLISLYIDPNHF